jgi:hypothetical protein
MKLDAHLASFYCKGKEGNRVEIVLSDRSCLVLCGCGMT